MGSKGKQEQPHGYHGMSASARAMKCSENTVRALERRGVIHPKRDSANRRQLSDDDIAAGNEWLERTRKRNGLA